VVDRAPYPDVEQLLLDVLADLGTCATVTPSDLQNHLPFIRLARFGGGNDQVSDAARVSIDAFGATRPDAYELAESIRQRLMSNPHGTPAGLIDLVETDTGPNEIPWGDVNVRRFNASYTVTTRRSVPDS
jgi:hypothetical protein